MKRITLLSLASAILFAFTSCKSEEKKDLKSVAKVEALDQKVELVKSIAKFNYTPTKPVNGKLKGVVELGSSGFNSFIINVDKDKNWEIKNKEFGNSLIAEGLTNSSEVNSKLRDYIQKLVEFGVSSKEIHFVVSSGAAKEDVTKLITQELKKIGYVVNVVTPEEEGTYALKSVLPSRFHNTAYVVDIGSGNTKISYLDNDKIISKESYGAKYFQKKIEDAEVYYKTKEIAATIPSGRKSQCFIIGGVPFQMAKSVRNADERYTVLSTNPEDFAKLGEEKGEKVQAGLNIFKAINDATGAKKVIFDWDANFTIGFLLDLDN